MFAKFLKLLSWVGLWRAPMVVLNDNAPAINLTTTPTQMVDMTARFMDVLVDNFVSEDRQKVSYLALEQSTFYKRNFDEFGSLLKKVDPLQMNDTERNLNFSNDLYNLLTIHSLLHMDSLPQSTLSVTDFWQRYYYKVGRYTLHLDDMEHGILRGNRPHPTSGDIMFKRNDPRLALTLPADPRIHGALNCGALSCPPLTWYDSSHLDQELDDALRGFCNKGVKAVSDSTLLINSIFDWWLANCVDDPAISEALLKAAEDQHYFTYHYDWTLNAPRTVINSISGGYNSDVGDGTNVDSEWHPGTHGSNSNTCSTNSGTGIILSSKV
ncbi:hypothetical protein Hamer_G010097 [Homarus americanus]|uniref:DUF547 domain-containing protein n=1 Tax=Homarus americanus TaxID=6706 RepID=A0A8J5K593_HOMAM|nr:hypothetical protein Hamer_G010097 [Homarus americanus]